MSIPTELSQQVFEFRGVDDLYVAEVTKDDETGYACSAPIRLAPVAEISKSVDTSQESHYYDNLPLIVIQGEGDDTIALTIAPAELQRLAFITGKSFDEDTGMMVDSPKQDKYYAIMYRTRGNDGKYRYVSRLKGKFSIPDDTSATEDNGTSANNQTTTFTGIYTTYKFTKGQYVGGVWEKAAAKGIVVDTRYNKADVSAFFSAVQTPDTVQTTQTVNVTTVSLAPATASLEVDGTVQLIPTVLPANATDKTVSYGSSDEGVATVSAAGIVTAVATGTATITVTTTDGGFTDTCAVTVGE